MLDVLLPLAQSPKMRAGDYGELMKALKKVRNVVWKCVVIGECSMRECSIGE